MDGVNGKTEQRVISIGTMVVIDQIQMESLPWVSVIDFEYYRLAIKQRTMFFSYIDHTSMTTIGYFLYVESDGHSPGDEAHLISQSYNANQSRCLRLWYHLYGEKQGTLQIQQKPEVGRPKILWSKSDDQGKILQLQISF